MRHLPVARRTFPVLLLASLLLASPAGVAAERWTYASSEHFEVYTTAGARHAREALTYFERIHAVFEDLLNLHRRPGPPTRLIIFSNAREYEPYKFNEFATAYYMPRAERDYIVMRSLELNAYPIVVHEYAHLMMRHSGNVYRPWLNEGLAEFFSTVQTRGNKIGLGQTSEGRLNYLKFSRTPLLELPRLFAVDHDSPEYTKHGQMFYSQSWALVHMLMTTSEYRVKASEFLDQMQKGVAAEVAFQSLYGKTLQVVRKDLQYHIENDKFFYFEADYRAPKSDSSYVVRDVDAFESALVTANLLGEMATGVDRARAAYDALAAERPDDLAVAEARADFEMRRGDRARAASLLKRAVELKTGNPKLLKLAASVAASDDERETLLRAAVAAAPEDMELRLSYAATLARAQRHTLVIATLAPLTRIGPEHAFMHFQLLANAYARLDRMEDAKLLATRAVQHARTDAERAYAEQLLKNVEFRAARAANAAPGPPSAGPAIAGPAGPMDRPSEAAVDRARRPSIVGFGKADITVDGRIRHMHCRSTPPVVEVQTTAATLRLKFDDPDLVQVLGKPEPEIDINCGAQDVKIRVGYVAAADPASGTHGLVRVLDYRP